MEYADNEMWDCIEAVRWPEVCKDHSPTRIQRHWKNCGFSRGKIFAASRFAQKMYNELMDKVDTFEQENAEKCGNYGGDDSYSDMLWHVVGCGRKTYHAIYADPTLLNGFRYTESFAYVLFREYDDWEQFELMHHHASIYRALGGLSYMKHQHGGEMPQEAKEVAKEMERRLFLVLDKGDVKGACGDFADPKTYDRFYKFEGNTESAMFANVLNDLYNCFC